MTLTHLLLLCLLAIPTVRAAAAGPRLDPDRSATIALAAPNASQVLILADFIADRTGVPMQKGENGTWTFKTGPLEYGYYFYRFNVDGLVTADPLNPLRRRGSVSSILEVRGPEPFPDDPEDKIPHGTVHIDTIYAVALGRAVKCYVYTPPGYQTTARKYPVLYLLHGGSGDPSNWTASGSADIMADNFIGRSQMKEMIIVMPHAEFPRARPYTEEVRKKWLDTFEHHLIEEVMPFAEKRYRITGTREDRWLAGLSNGGSQTLHVGFRRADLFSVMAPFSTRLRDGFEADYPFLQDAAKFNGGMRLFYFACGEEDHNWEGFKTSHAALKKLGIEHEWVATPGAHNWYNWRRYLADLLPRL
jgi:enterochelin esterase family protein